MTISESSAQPRGRPEFLLVHRLAIAAVVVTIALTCGLGGTITSTEVGMAYPTWPDINGGSLFSMFYTSLADSFGWGSVIEHSHRQAGALTGLIVLAMALCAVFSRGMPPAWKGLAASSLLLVTGQGLLGANRVLSNSYGGAIAHALGAQAVIVVLVAVVKLTSADSFGSESPPSRGDVSRLRLWASVSVVLAFLNLFSAASLRHKQGALEGHLVLACTTAVMVFVLSRHAASRFRQHSGLRRNARRLVWLMSAQLVLGIFSWALLLGPLGRVFGSDETRFFFQSLVATSHLLGGVVVMALVAAVWMDAGGEKQRLLRSDRLALNSDSGQALPSD